jgi:hypothetical protein
MRELQFSFQKSRVFRNVDAFVGRLLTCSQCPRHLKSRLLFKELRQLLYCLSTHTGHCFPLRRTNKLTYCYYCSVRNESQAGQFKLKMQVTDKDCVVCALFLSPQPLSCNSAEGNAFPTNAALPVDEASYACCESWQNQWRWRYLERIADEELSPFCLSQCLEC